jgi:hypothetical protein
MFDISTITDASTACVELKHPITGASLGAIITLAGPENAARKAIEFAKQRKVRAAIQKTGKLELSDPADDELDLVEKLAACTVGWSGISDAGKEIEFTKSAAEKLYGTEGLGWMRAQLATAMDERERFITACVQS